MNRVMLLGRLGNDAEVKALQNGQVVIKFSVATSEKWKDKNTGEAKERAEWHRCVYFTKTAGIAPYLTKGAMIGVEGAMTYGSYEKDGVKHYTADVKVARVHFTGGGKGAAAPATADPDGLDAPDDGDGEPPF